MSDAVDVALAEVECDTYVLGADGQQLSMVTPLGIMSSFVLAKRCSCESGNL